MSQTSKYIKTESILVVSRGSREGSMRSYSFISIEFWFYKINKFSRSAAQLNVIKFNMYT